MQQNLLITKKYQKFMNSQPPNWHKPAQISEPYGMCHSYLGNWYERRIKYYKLYLQIANGLYLAFIRVHLSTSREALNIKTADVSPRGMGQGFL